MSFDPSLLYQHGGIATPDQTDTTDITGTPAGVDPSEDPTRNEYYSTRLQTPPWIQAGFPDYQSYAANLRLKEEQARALSQKQIDASAGASGASVTAANISTQGANQRAAVQAEIDRAKNAADAAHQQAIDALSQGNAAEAKRQFDISSAELQRYHSLDIADRQQQQSLASAKFGNDVYTQLANLASNPRNFMEQFFRNRGQTPPANVGQYGNTSVTGPGLMSAQQFIPSFLGSLGLGGNAPSSPGAGAANSPATSASPPPAQNAQGQSWQPGQANPYAGTNTNYGGSPTTADTALINGVKTWAGGAYSGQPVASSPADAGDLTPYLKQGQAAGQARMMAQGGEVTMTAPHALINLLTGKVAAIAGEAGKEHAKFDGAAIIDPLKTQTTTDPIPPDGSTTPTYTDPAVGKPYGDPITYTDPTSDPNYTGGDPALTSTYNYPQGSPTPQPTSTTTPPPPQFILTPELIAQARAAAATANSALPAGAVGGSVPPPPITTTTPPPPTTTFTPPTNPVNSWGGPMIQPTTPIAPLNFTPPSFLSSTPSGLGQNPQFLPEDAAAKDPIVAQMLAAGSFPPFLQRLYAQAKGLPGLGTNVPQTTDLPAGVPLVSKLAYNQMSPSEQQAFASFLSAHGITLEDYLTMVEAASPQGGTSPANPAVPKFLSQGG